MAEYVHECEHKYGGALCPIPEGGFAYYIFCTKCEYKPPLVDTIKSLNATERLSAEGMLLKLYNDDVISQVQFDYATEAYADILEGK